jgi:hypothetical protein
MIMAYTYLTTEELSARIKFDPRTIRNQLKDSVLLEGLHYIRPFGGRKLLFLWEPIEEEMLKHSAGTLPMWKGCAKASRHRQPRKCCPKPNETRKSWTCTPTAIRSMTSGLPAASAAKAQYGAYSTNMV